MRDFCFVIQPYQFDHRYRDIIQPTVESFGLLSYRVDEDYGAEVPVDAMGKKIPEAKLVIAEITTDRPNIWFELGYAAACGNPLILVCSDERTTRLPFDIRHRNVLYYRTGSLHDFREYQQKLESYIRVRYSAGKTDASELSREELALLRLISRDQTTPFAITAEEKIWESASHDSAVDNLRTLVRKGFLRYWYSTTDRTNYYHITEKAEHVLLESGGGQDNDGSGSQSESG